MGKKICTTCKVRQSLNEFTKDKTTEDGLESRCKRCHAIRSAQSNARKRVNCGNRVRHCGGKKAAVADLAEGTWCKRHASYAGATYDIYDKFRFNTWLQKNWFDGATLDRIDPTIGYVCYAGDVITNTRFGNIELVTWAVNHAKIRFRRKAV